MGKRRDEKKRKGEEEEGRGERQGKNSKRLKSQSLICLSTELSEMQLPDTQGDVDAITRCMLRMARLSHRIQLHLNGHSDRPLRLNDLHRWEKSTLSLNQAMLGDLEAVVNPPPALDRLAPVS